MLTRPLDGQTCSRTRWRAWLWQVGRLGKASRVNSVRENAGPTEATVTKAGTHKYTDTRKVRDHQYISSGVLGSSSNHTWPHSFFKWFTYVNQGFSVITAVTLGWGPSRLKPGREKRQQALDCMTRDGSFSRRPTKATNTDQGRTFHSGLVEHIYSADSCKIGLEWDHSIEAISLMLKRAYSGLVSELLSNYPDYRR